MNYKNYRIEPRQISGYEAYNTLDCDEPMITAKTVEEIVEIINEKDTDDETEYLSKKEEYAKLLVDMSKDVLSFTKEIKNEKIPNLKNILIILRKLDHCTNNELKYLDDFIFKQN